VAKRKSRGRGCGGKPEEVMQSVQKGKIKDMGGCRGKKRVHEKGGTPFPEEKSSVKNTLPAQNRRGKGPSSGRLGGKTASQKKKGGLGKSVKRKKKKMVREKSVRKLRGVIA